MVTTASVHGVSMARWHPMPSFPLYARFQRALEVDLHYGVINEVCGADEPLKLLSSPRVGDRHVYFTISNMRIESNRSIAQLDHVDMDGDGVGVEQTRYIEIDRGQHASMSARYREIDRSARELIQRNPFTLFHNHTRKVYLRGERSGRVYTVFYKPGRIAGAEHVGRLFLGAANLRVSRLLPSLLPHACWIEGMEGRTFESILRDCLSCGKPLSWWLYRDEEGSERLFSTIGRAIGTLYLCGNRDFHAENLLIGPSRHAAVVDLECAGCPPFSGDRQSHDPVTRAIRCALEGVFLLKGLFVRNERLVFGELKLNIGSRYIDALREGAESVFKLFRESDGLLEGILSSVPQEFYARMVIYPTRMYTEGFGLRHSIPHYTMPVDKDRFVADIRQRLSWLEETHSAPCPAWDGDFFLTHNALLLS